MSEQVVKRIDKASKALVFEDGDIEQTAVHVLFFGSRKESPTEILQKSPIIQPITVPKNQPLTKQYSRLTNKAYKQKSLKVKTKPRDTPRITKST